VLKNVSIALRIRLQSKRKNRLFFSKTKDREPSFSVFSFYFSDVFSSFSAWHPQQEEQDPEQVFESGHPMHRRPFFFSRIIYTLAAPISNRITAIAIISAGVITLPPPREAAYSF
jgi:hypothetical protein